MPQRSPFSLAHVPPLLRRLRAGERRRARDPQPRGAEPGLARFAGDRRRELLEAIAGFLLEHELAVTPDNLTLAWQAFSGAVPGLARRIAGRAASGEPIDQPWLDALAADGGSGPAYRDLRLLLDALDHGVRQFARTALAARSATHDYRSDLDRHALALDGATPADPGADAAARLAALARAMAERTRRAEAELHAREQEAKALRKRLGQAVREAERDHLTGLPNRRAFEAELERQHAEAAAAGEPLSLAFCDVDHFKAINDAHGHEAGDRVLKLIAQLLARRSNGNCHVARHGGEEFVLLFRGLTPDEARARLDSAREDLAARSLLNRDTRQPFGQVTFSAGVARVAAGGDPREALRAADEALYRAKQQGRNRVLLA
jgi:diguanylate cyclase